MHIANGPQLQASIHYIKTNDRPKELIFKSLATKEVSKILNDYDLLILELW